MKSSFTINDLNVASYLLQKTGITVVQAARLVLEMVEEGQTSSFSELKEIVHLGKERKKERQRTVLFEEAVREYLTFKRYLRPRTLADIRQFSRRMLRLNDGLDKTPLCDFSEETCRDVLEKSFFTLRQKIKGRSFLSGLFSFGKRKGWCSCNPVKTLALPPLRETPVTALSPEEAKRLMETAWKELGGTCAAAVALMLYAGIRPNEVERLTWGQINDEEKVVALGASHSKTGGCRHVTFSPVLLSWLKRCRKRLSPLPEEKICPRGWKRKWKRVRVLAGWGDESERPWVQDCLRHTFASYHLKLHRNLPLLQLEMGHASLTMLRFRYLNMQGITREKALRFWKTVA